MLFVPKNEMLIGGVMSGLESAAKDFLTIPLNFFSAILKLIYEILEINPIEGTYKDAWIQVKDINNTFMIIGTTLLTIFFIYGFCRDSVDIRSEVRMESIIKMFIRYVIGVNLITCFIEYVPKLCGMAIQLTSVTEASLNYKPEKIATSIVKESGAIMGFVIALLMFIITFACGAIMFYSCLGRFLNFYLLVPFSSIALSTIVGGGQLSQTGWTYIKNILALIFEIVAMGLVLAIIGPFLQGSVFDGLESYKVLKHVDLKPWFVLLETIVKMITVTAVFKGASGTVRKAMNL